MRAIFCKGQMLGPISGADETLVTYATQLKRAGHSVSVLLMYPHSPAEAHYLCLREAGVPVSSLASNIARTSLGTGRRLFRRLLRAAPSSQSLVRKRAQRLVTGMADRHYQRCRERLEQSRPDLIHVLTPDPAAMVMIRAAHAAGVPVIYQELGTPYHPPDFASYYAQFTTALPLCSEVAALSPRLAETCRAKLPHTQALSVLPIMSGAAGNGHHAERSTDGDVTFGFAGRIESLKGPLVLLEAFGAACRRRASIQLKVAGDGSQRKLLTERAASLDVARRYQYAGVYSPLPEREAFMRSLDVFVMPSFTEGTPNTIAEAMAQGKPVIASRVGGIPDMLDEESGILTPPGDVAAFADAMLRLAQDARLRSRMGAAARARYLKLFSPEAVLPVMLDTYRRVAGHDGSEHSAAAGDGARQHPWAGRVV